MECTAALSLLDAYIETLHAFHAAQRTLLEARKPGGPDYQRARIAGEEAYVVFHRARGIYWKHVQMHGCRNSLSQPNLRREIQTRLHSDLIDARRRFDAAVAESGRLYAIAEDAAGTRDGTFAVRRGGDMCKTAHQSYRLALQRFTDFVTDGVVPEDLEHSHSQ